MLLAEVVEAKFVFPEKLTGLDGWLEMFSSLFREYPLLGVLLSLIVLDIATGVLASGIANKLSSVVSYKGVMKKGVMILAVVVAKIMEAVIPQAPLMTLGCLGFIGVELFSIIENCGKAGVPIPAKLMSMFEKFRAEKIAEEKPPTVVQVNVDESVVAPKKSPYKRPSDVVINVNDSGEVSVEETGAHSAVVIGSRFKGEKGDQGKQGEHGVKGDKGEKGETGAKGDRYPPNKGT